MTETLTTAEVAQVLGVTPSAVRQLVRRGALRPVHGGRPLRFRWLDVERAVVDRWTDDRRQRFDELVAIWRDLGPDTATGA